MPWLLRDGKVLAAIEVASTRRARRRGLLGRDGIDGALLLRPAHGVHTIGMRFAIDVAFCAPGAPGASTAPTTVEAEVPDRPDQLQQPDQLVVLETVCMSRFRLGRPRWRASCVIEAQAGAFERWSLRPGDLLEVR